MSVLSRREMLLRTAQMAAVGVLVGGGASAVRSEPLGTAPGIQLWSVNDVLSADPAGTLGRLREIGYRHVETAGFRMPPVGQLRKLLNDTGLDCPSAHLDFMGTAVEVLFEQAHALGARYAVSSILRLGTGPDPQPGRPELQRFAGMMKTMTLEDAKRTAELANRIGTQAKQAGLQYAYHNHFFEFVEQGGMLPYDLLLQNTDPELVKFEIDCGWMRVAGYDPVSYLVKYPGRFPMIHVKDFKPAPEHTAPLLRVGTELGRGFIDYRPVFAAARVAGVKQYFVEQEGPFAPGGQLPAAKLCHDYLASID